MDPPTSDQTIPRPLIDLNDVHNQPPMEIKPAGNVIDWTQNDSSSSGLNLRMESDSNTNIITQTTTDDVDNTINSTQTSTQAILKDKYVRLYHEHKSYMVLEQYYLPVSTVNPTIYKFPFRNCVVQRSKIIETGEQLSDISPIVYKPDPTVNKKLSYRKLDARYVRCFMSNCVDSDAESSKAFHFLCHVHNVNLKGEENYKLIEYKGGNDVLLDQVSMNDNEIKQQIREFPTMNTKLIFPLCSKRCFNSLQSHRKKKGERGTSYETERKRERGTIQTFCKQQPKG
jgi:hypothetical protein